MRMSMPLLSRLTGIIIIFLLVKNIAGMIVSELATCSPDFEIQKPTSSHFLISTFDE